MRDAGLSAKAWMDVNNNDYASVREVMEGYASCTVVYCTVLFCTAGTPAGPASCSTRTTSTATSGLELSTKCRYFFNNLLKSYTGIY